MLIKSRYAPLDQRRAERFALHTHYHLGATRLDNNGLELRTRPITGASAVIRLRRAQPDVKLQEQNAG